MSRLELLRERLALYLDAERRILAGAQSWSSPDGMTYTRASLATLAKKIEQLENEIALIDPDWSSGGGFGAQTFVFGGRR
ncbi:MAG: hypothetical protein ACOX5Z_00160 [Desulfobulbus sp.]|jgi:hypothetical protein